MVSNLSDVSLVFILVSLSASCQNHNKQTFLIIFLFFGLNTEKSDTEVRYLVINAVVVMQHCSDYEETYR